MPRRLLRDGRIVEDEWRYTADGPDDGSSPLILKLCRMAEHERERWLGGGPPPGRAARAHAQSRRSGAGSFAAELIGAEFPTANDGRGYSQGRQLREHWNFRGELRAVGYVRRDQLFLMARAGFNSFEVQERDLEIAAAALADFSYAYQPMNDAGLEIGPRHRWPDTAATA